MTVVPNLPQKRFFGKHPVREKAFFIFLRTRISALDSREIS